MKNLLRRLLETAILGRTLRKVLWLFYKFTLRMHHIAAVALRHHPYVQKIDRGFESRHQSESDSGLLRYYGNLKDSLNRLPYQPKISVLIPVYKVPDHFLKECLASLSAQIYENWEACIVDDCSNSPSTLEIIKNFQKKWPERVHFSVNESNQHISVTSNRALDLATGDYVSLLDHDDRLLPNALGEVIRFINLHENPEILYSDESVIDENGQVLGTYNKPDWSPFMHLSVNYTTHLSTYKTELLRRIGGFRKGLEGAQDHDLMLRAVEASNKPVVHIPISLYQWRSHEASTAKDSDAKPYAATAGIQTVREACERRGRTAEVIFEPKIHHYRLRFALRGPLPLVSIIVLSRDGFELISACLRSLFEISTYQAFEVVLIDHESQDPRCLQLFSQYEESKLERFRRIPYTGPFNFAEMNNLGVSQARGNFVVLMNNDVEVITPSWIEELLSYAQFPEVGAVGPKLLYPDKNIQHAGILGLESRIAGHAGLHEKSDSLSYFGYHQTTHEALGVTGACLMVSKAKYLEVGGLEERYVPNGFGDVDFCLRLRARSYSNIYVPYANLYHKESVTRKRSFELFEKYYMLHNWSKELTLDPYRNICFEAGHHFKPDEHYRIQQPSPKVLKNLLNFEAIHS